MCRSVDARLWVASKGGPSRGTGIRAGNVGAVSIELPGEVVQLLQFIGVNWPNIDEDRVREPGQLVRQFAENLQATHQDATAHLQQAGQHYKGAGYEAMVAAWGQKSDAHMSELVSACGVVATALDAGADVIVGMKGAPSRNWSRSRRRSSRTRRRRWPRSGSRRRGWR